MEFKLYLYDEQEWWTGKQKQARLHEYVKNAYTRSYSYKIKQEYKTQIEVTRMSNNDLPVSIQAWYILLAAATGKLSSGFSASSRISVNTIIPGNTR